MTLLHPLLNNVTVLSPPVLLTGTLSAIIGMVVTTILPMAPLIPSSLLVERVEKRAKLNSIVLSPISRFVRLIRALSTPCRVVRKRRVVARPCTAVLCIEWPILVRIPLLYDIALLLETQLRRRIMFLRAPAAPLMANLNLPFPTMLMLLIRLLSLVQNGALESISATPLLLAVVRPPLLLIIIVSTLSLFESALQLINGAPLTFPAVPFESP